MASPYVTLRSQGGAIMPPPGQLGFFDLTGLRHNWCMAEIMWHRRETRRKTENTNVMPVALEGLILLDKNSNSLFL
jgi:hypothetical protein